MICRIIGHKSSGKWKYDAKTGNIYSICKRCGAFFVKRSMRIKIGGDTEC